MAFGDPTPERIEKDRDWRRAGGERYQGKRRAEAEKTGQRSTLSTAKREARRAQPISPASKAQREKVAWFGDCIVCGDEYQGRYPLDPAHLIDRSLCPDPEGDSLRVVPLCRAHHRAYDEEGLDLSPYLEPAWREEVAEAVRLVGAWCAINRITNRRWTEDKRTEAA